MISHRTAALLLLVALATGTPHPTAAQAVPQPPRPPTAGPAIHLDAIPEIFAPGVVSRELAEFGAAFTDEGRTVFFTVTDFGFRRMVIFYSRFEEGRWSEPRVAPFSGVWDDGDVASSPDGNRVFFVSNRPLPNTAAKTPSGRSAPSSGDFDIWYVDRTTTGSWGEPRHAGAELASDGHERSPTVSRDGTLYFGRGREILRARPVGALYGNVTPVELPGYSSPAIAPDGSFLIIAGQAAENNSSDLFVSFREGDGWSMPRPLQPVNTPWTEIAASVSRDGRTLYYSSQPRSPVERPRPHRLETYADFIAELQADPENGLRNVYRIDISGLREHRP